MFVNEANEGDLVFAQRYYDMAERKLQVTGSPLQDEASNQASNQQPATNNQQRKTRNRKPETSTI